MRSINFIYFDSSKNSFLVAMLKGLLRTPSNNKKAWDVSSESIEELRELALMYQSFSKPSKTFGFNVDGAFYSVDEIELLVSELKPNSRVAA